MKRKTLPLVLLLLINIQSAFSQIKNYIPILKPVQYEKTKETFENIAQKFEQKNYPDLAEIFRSFAMGGHGSGFVYVDKDGENYIITNRHVVANSEFVNLEFVGKGSTKTVYEACPIVYTDDDIDLAVVKFQNNEKVFTKSFSINTTKQIDGQEIWSAGFPGLLGKPVWQFAKGNITNEEAYIDQLVSPDVSYLIQHSASIDPGNSGGPLVIKDEHSAEGYSVIGINSWMITNRQNTFFAIPSKNIPGLVSKAKRIIALKENKDSLRINLIERCKLFAAEINSDKPKWDNVRENISYAFVGYKGWDSFLTMLNDSDSETLKELESRFFHYSPIEAMRYAILYQIWKRVYSKKEKLSVIQYKGINIADEQQFAKAKPIRTNFVVNGIEQEIEWTFEHGHWRINNYDLDKYYAKDEEKPSEGNVRSEKKKNSESTAYFGLTAFATPYTRCSDADLNNGFNLKGFGGAVNFTVHRFSMFIRVNSLSLDNKMKNPLANVTEASVEFLHVSQGMMIYLTRKKFSPYLLSGITYTEFSETGKFNNFSTTNKFERLGSLWGAGFRYKITKKVGIFCEGAYYSDVLLPYVIESALFDTSPPSQNLSTLQAMVGISFDFRRK